MFASQKEIKCLLYDDLKQYIPGYRALWFIQVAFGSINKHRCQFEGAPLDKPRYISFELVTFKTSLLPGRCLTISVDNDSSIIFRPSELIDLFI